MVNVCVGGHNKYLMMLEILVWERWRDLPFFIGIVNLFKHFGSFDRFSSKLYTESYCCMIIFAVALLTPGI